LVSSVRLRRLLRELLPAPVRERYHRHALARDFGIDARTGVRRRSPFDRKLSRGVNLVAPFDSTTGVGQSARSLAAACEAAGIPVAKVEVASLGSGPSPGAPYALNLFHVNADAAAAAVELCGPDFHRGRANVGYWYWETEDFPKPWHDRFAYFDELWVASEFCRAAIQRRSPITVAVVPPPVVVGDPALPTESRSERFRFLTICDAESVPERKNPLGAVRAFARAFPSETEVSLQIRIANAESAPGLVDSLSRAAGAARVEIESAFGNRSDVERLLAGCDAYVSLHRAEGFGLPIAEAMAFGKPVVATGYSGPCDFLDDTTGYPVRWARVALDRALGPYPAGTRWAEPDEEHAVEMLRRVVADRAESARRGEAGKQRIHEGYGLPAAARRLAGQLDQLLSRLAARS
jgi:glycosyltransferase involved in cell wall biosynthesis